MFNSRKSPVRQPLLSMPLSGSESKRATKQQGDKVSSNEMKYATFLPETKEVRLPIHNNYKKEVEELNQSIALLKVQIRKRNLIVRSLNLIYLAALFGIAGDMTRCVLVYNHALEGYLKATDKWRSGDTILCKHNDFIESKKIEDYSFFEQTRANCKASAYDNFLRNNLNKCYSSVMNICDGPGMWEGYTLVMYAIALVIVGVGISTYCRLSMPSLDGRLREKQNALKALQDKIKFNKACQFEVMIWKRRQNNTKAPEMQIGAGTQADQNIYDKIFKYAGISNS